MEGQVNRLKFLTRLSSEIGKRGVIDVLRKGVDHGPVHFDRGLLQLLREAAERTGQPTMPMVSPAGHDAGWVARRVPTAMLFVPCRDGLSHHPDEWAGPEHLELATRVLADTLESLAG